METTGSQSTEAVSQFIFIFSSNVCIYLTDIYTCGCMCVRHISDIYLKSVDKSRLTSVEKQIHCVGVSRNEIETGSFEFVVHKSNTSSMLAC